MPACWRILRTRYAADPFSGEGARLFGGRWNSPGRPVVYLSEHQSLATLEVFVNTGPIAPRHEYSVVGATWDDRFMERLRAADLPAQWTAFPAGHETAALGDAWLSEARSAVLAVPSVIIPAETNFLLNPVHPDFRRLQLGPAGPFLFDRRLLQR